MGMPRPYSSTGLRSYRTRHPAHLPLEFGGRNIAAVKGGKRTLAKSPVQLLFAGTDDSDYQKMLTAIEEGKRIMLANPEADMPGFRQARPEP